MTKPHLKFLSLPTLFGTERTKEILSVNPTVIPEREDAETVNLAVYDYDGEVLNEFTSGNVAKRLIVGLGAGRSVVDTRLVVTGEGGRELANVKIRVKGSFLFNAYQGGDTQRRQATTSLDQKLAEEIARLK